MTLGQPALTISAMVLPGANPSCTTVSLTTPSPAGSMSKVAVDRGSAAMVARNPASQPNLEALDLAPRPSRFGLKQSPGAG